MTSPLLRDRVERLVDLVPRFRPPFSPRVPPPGAFRRDVPTVLIPTLVSPGPHNTGISNPLPPSPGRYRCSGKTTDRNPVVKGTDLGSQEGRSRRDLTLPFALPVLHQLRVKVWGTGGPGQVWSQDGIDR